MLSSSHILLLEKVMHLGRRLERTKTFDLLEPWTFNGYDLIEIQNAGKKISRFMGLPDFTFIISYAHQADHVAGHIELNHNSDEAVHIEIDERYKSLPEVILAILAHEICHKLIHLKGLTLPGYENEILTDTATIYTGLGKLSLNGCVKRVVSRDLHWDGQSTSTTTHKVGYLSRDQFAFLYHVICNMRQIPEAYAHQGLSPQALDALIRTRYDHTEELFHNDYALKQVNKALEQSSRAYHLSSAKTIQLMKTLEVNLQSATRSYQATHQHIQTTHKKYQKKATEQLHPGSLTYIKNIILIHELQKLDKAYETEVQESSLLNHAIQTCS